MDIRAKNVVITGGSSGIGRATATLLAKQGANIFIIARNRQRIDEALTEIETVRVSEEQKFGAFPADVTDYGDIESAIAAVAETYGGTEILINSAGIARPGHFQELPLSDFTEHIETNYLGTVYATKAVVPGMIARGSGYIVNVSSVAGVLGVFGYTAYGASKFAVLGLSEVLRIELKPHNIGVSVVIPSDTDTPQLEEERLLQPLETKISEGIIKPDKLQGPAEHLAYWFVRAMNDGGKPLDAEQVAKALVEGIRKDQYLIVPDRMLGIAYYLRGIVVPLANWAFDRLVPVARRQAQAN